MFKAIIALFAIFAVRQITPFPTDACPESDIDDPIVDSFNVTTFLDKNRYIRLNISWGEPVGNEDFLDILIDNGDGCSSIYGVENYTINNHYIIKPSMEMEHPADQITHGCVYNITLKATRNNSCYVSQFASYNVPECVENVCKCRDLHDSPFKLESINLISENIYEIRWNETEYINNVHVHEIFYERKNSNNTISYVHYNEIRFESDGSRILVPLYDLKKGMSYVLTAEFQIDDCLYFSSIDLIVPPEPPHTTFMIFSGIFFVMTVALLSYVIYTRFPRIVMKLKMYLPFFPEIPPIHEPHNMMPLITIKEEVNAQYTPLEFILKAHKYDCYEFPRNKIIVERELGRGAFGTVYSAKAYQLGGQPGYTAVAVKQIKEKAPEEEVLDFLTEIEILKKVVKHEGHKNVIKMFACVTMDQPYMMVMELVTCGALKKYLINLREKWEQDKKVRVKRLVGQRFFGEDMDNWFPQNGTTVNKEIKSHLNYTSCVFDDTDGNYILPETIPDIPAKREPPRQQSSYVPHTPSPSSSPTPTIVVSSPGHRQTMRSDSPATPLSITSSRLPSTTETLMSSLEMETPLIDEFVHTLEPALDHTELQYFALQIARGMEFLENIPITHRDLAARNILITGDKVLKISDFGMSRTGPYVNKKLKKMPLRWMAIEAIKDLKCDSKSDVWSFAVVLWEIGTLGAFPYERTHDSLILENLLKGDRLERPEICTDDLYQLMRRCWSEKPEDRPDFKELVETLDVSERKVYVDFSKISPKYVFPPTTPPGDRTENLVANCDSKDK